VPVTQAAGDQVSPKIIADGSGGAIIAWTDARNGATDIFAQRLNSAGAPQWDANGLAVSTAAGSQGNVQLATDGSGGAILTWEDRRNPATGSDIFAQRVSGAGAPMWTINGVAVTTAIDDQTSPQLIADGSGGAIIVWVDMRSFSTPGATTGVDIFAQRLDSTGALQWKAGAVANPAVDGVAVTTDFNQFNVQLAQDGSGGAIIVWEDDRNSFSDIFAQRIDGNGQTLWAENGMPVTLAANNQSAPQVTVDGSGGVIVAWQDFRSGVRSDVYAQRMDGTGRTLWTVNGAPVSVAANDQANQRLVADGSGGAIITWEDGRSGTFNVFAQRMNRAGVAQWSTDGVAVSLAANQMLAGSLMPQLVSDGAGGAIIVWTDDRNNASTVTDIYAQGVTAGGAQ